MASLSITQLFQAATQSDWLATLLRIAQKVGLKATQWQSGGVAQTILQIVSYVLQNEDISISIIAQAGFLDFAANGSITFQDPNGNTTTIYVTPDPSNPAQNPTGQLGWLDVLADSVYNVQRTLASSAGGIEVLLNTSITTYGPFAAGTYHVADPYPTVTPTYSNASPLTIAPSTLVGTSITNVTNVLLGSVIEVTTAANHGLSTGAYVALTGIGGATNVSGAWTLPLTGTTAWQITVTGNTTFTLNGSNFGGSYTSGGLVYVPTVAQFQADVPGSASSSVDPFGVLNLNTITQPVTSLVGVTVANPVEFIGSDIQSNAQLVDQCRLKLQSISPAGTKGAYTYYALNAQTYAKNITNPLTGTPYVVSSPITRATTLVLFGTIGVYIANAQGAPSTADQSAVSAVIQAFSPLTVVASAFKAIPQTVAVVVNAWLPTSQNNTTNQALFEKAIQTYISNFPIGGVSDPKGSYTDILPIDGVLGAVYAAAQVHGIPLQDVTVTINGSTADVPLSFGGAPVLVAVLSPVVPTVNLIGV